MLSSIQMLVAPSTVVTTKNFSRLCQIIPRADGRGQIAPSWEPLVSSNWVVYADWTRSYSLISLIRHLGNEQYESRVCGLQNRMCFSSHIAKAWAMFSGNWWVPAAPPFGELDLESLKQLSNRHVTHSCEKCCPGEQLQIASSLKSLSKDGNSHRW